MSITCAWASLVTCRTLIIVAESQSRCPATGKIAHPSPAAAKAHIKSLYKTGRGNPDYRVYPCEHTHDGKHWHIGHSRASLDYRIRKALRGRNK